jgi:hypothetical protein
VRSAAILFAGDHACRGGAGCLTRMQGAGSVPFLYREGDREMQLSEPDSRIGLPIEPNVFGLIRISRRVRFLGTIDAAPESISNPCRSPK